MAFVQNSDYVFTIISDAISVNDLAKICDKYTKGDKISVVVNHTDRYVYEHFSGIKKSTLSVGDKFATDTGITIHFINTKTKAEFKVPLRRDGNGNIIWW